MKVLDTNIVSELIRQKPNKHVLQWVNAQDAKDLALTSISVAELLYGAARLPDGKRKTALKSILLSIFAEDFHNRIIPFDDIAAAHYADLVVKREKAGRPINMGDAQIAAICQAYDAILVTRNIKDFGGLDVSLINPWDPE